jgi:hypothetical protein
MTWVRFLGYATFSALGQVYQVVILDKILSQNTKWEDATVTEMSQLKEYECFIDAGIYIREAENLFTSK